MGNYLPSSDVQKKEMLDALGIKSASELFSDVPGKIKLKTPLNIPCGKSELETRNELERLASENKVYSSVFRGAGAYNHYIPAIVTNITQKDEFVTAYTPYQPELSQGILQSIFEYQSMMCALTGMDVSNASVYDGATAAAESLAMCRDRAKTKALISATSKPQNVEVMKTYSHSADAPYALIPEKDGATDIEALEKLITPDVSCVYVELPNFYGIIEDIDAIVALAHKNGIKVILGTDPIYLGSGKTPREYGADIAVGEAQSLGMPLSFGGPYLGYMTCVADMQRKLPGRIVGKTTDAKGNDAYVLTLQAREQHIRREKASSNICSNQAHCALTASVYLAALGADGLERVSLSCHSKAEYLKQKLLSLGKYKLLSDKETFCEFVTVGGDAKKTEKLLSKHGILSGLVIGKDKILWCATETNTKEQIDALAEILAKEAV